VADEIDLEKLGTPFAVSRDEIRALLVAATLGRPADN
jgi:hypothetical protein